MDSSSASSFDLAGGADTIVAPATPPGRGALAIVRISGPRAAELVTRVCPALDVAAVRRAQLVEIRDGGGAVLERAVAVRYAAPRSYTGEDMVELTVHGSPALVRRTVELLVDAGCRPARPGELTRRAVA
ncbi:MAG TPA: tRNA uridine-5-carboxymethylaminomethyl(34) synthesis GTPase MnmE, partial [Acidobacteria bacterium]|nr:tRNA uridine-5-carboxymethylaminomethyl(34) synthesis GTPase MnmE [Acidobacteriota bacterium]